MSTTKDSNEVVQNLIKARNIIKRNWIQRYMKKKTQDFPKEYGYCAIGAMYAAKYGEDAQPRRDRLPYRESIVFKKANNIVYIESWNDHHRRTKEEVVAAFNKAIELAREESE